jgi:hypothetical protein
VTRFVVEPSTVLPGWWHVKDTATGYVAHKNICRKNGKGLAYYPSLLEARQFATVAERRHNKPVAEQRHAPLLSRLGNGLDRGAGGTAGITAPAVPPTTDKDAA